jgi:hypothetical protein
LPSIWCNGKGGGLSGLAAAALVSCAASQPAGVVATKRAAPSDAIEVWWFLTELRIPTNNLIFIDCFQGFTRTSGYPVSFRRKFLWLFVASSRLVGS